MAEVESLRSAVHHYQLAENEQKALQKNQERIEKLLAVDEDDDEDEDEGEEDQENTEDGEGPQEPPTTSPTSSAGASSSPSSPVMDPKACSGVELRLRRRLNQAKLDLEALSVQAADKATTNQTLLLKLQDW